ncbi:MAG TPA: hypothetical protein DCR43_05975 [Bacteroidales bacterium]|nr:MAG: hypothetical protein A2X09_14510 [Bacteroidetes bacterium GWF2_43_11]HAQ65382.1 hypothetical protein [Bacteroidales bacterium]HBZ65695.1 hypothetical protein [Bacteroidales bacterium]
MCILLNAYRVNTKTVPGPGILFFCYDYGYGFNFDFDFNCAFNYGFDGSIISLFTEIVVNKSSGWYNRRMQTPLTARIKQILLAIDSR